MVLQALGSIQSRVGETIPGTEYIYDVTHARNSKFVRATVCTGKHPRVKTFAF